LIHDGQGPISWGPEIPDDLDEDDEHDDEEVGEDEAGPPIFNDVIFGMEPSRSPPRTGRRYPP
jgi:hypothetical protein